MFIDVLHYTPSLMYIYVFILINLLKSPVLSGEVRFNQAAAIFITEYFLDVRKYQEITTVLKCLVLFQSETIIHISALKCRLNKESRV